MTTPDAPTTPEVKPVNNYVDKQEFFDLLMERKALLAKCEAEGLPKPKINDKIGKMIFDIATNLSYRYNFINYTFREEMVGDGIETCVKYLDNFDPEKSKNAFGYYTQICYYAFVRRITKEKKQADIKKKWIETLVPDQDAYGTQAQDADKNYTNTSAEFAQENMT